MSVGSERDRVTATDPVNGRAAIADAGRTCPVCGKIVRRSVCTRCGTRLDSGSAVATDPVRPQIPAIQAQLDAAASMTVSRAATQWGLALLAADRPDDALNAFTAALTSKPTSGQRPNLLLLQAYATELSGQPEQALRGYLDAIRGDSRLISDTAARLHALLTARTADLLGPWITSQWVDSVCAALADQADTRRETARLELFVAHVHALRREYDETIASLRAAMTAAPDDVAASAADLPRWVAASLEDPNDAPYTNVLLAELDLMLGSYNTALAHADDALSGWRAASGDPYGDARAYLLRGQALRQLGRQADAITALLDAGRQYSWQPSWEQAQSVLQDVIDLDPQCQEAFWLLANVVANRAILQAIDEPAVADADALRDAVAIWERGYALGPPATTDDAWAFFVLGWIYGRLAATSTADSSEYHWRAVLCVERGLVLSGNASAQVDLSWHQRALGNYAVQQQAVEEGERQLTADDASYPDLLFEKALSLTSNSGDYAQALALLDEYERLRASDENPAQAGLISQVRGIVTELAGDLPAGRDELERSLKVGRSLQVIRNLAECCRLLRDTDAEREYFGQILAGTTPGAPTAEGYQLERAVALYSLGQPGEALTLLAALTNSPWLSPSDRAWLDAHTGLCLLALGRPEAPEVLRGAAARITSVSAAESLEAELRVAGLDPRLADVFEQRAREIAARPVDLAAAEAELRQAMETPEAPALVRAACLATIGRMRLAAADQARAAQAYEELLAEETLFPEAASRYVQAVWEQLTSRLRADELPQAAELAEHALRQLLAPAPRGGVARLAALASMARLRQGDYPAALHWLGTAAEHSEDNLTAAQLAGEEWRGSLGSPSAYWQLADRLTQCRELADDRLAQVLDAAAQECGRYLDQRFGLASAPADSEAFTVEPVAVVLGKELIEDIEVKMVPGVGDIRTRIKDTYGVTVPGVRFRDDQQLPGNAYSIWFHGTVRLEGQASMDPDPDAPYGPIAQVFASLETLFISKLDLFIGTEEIEWLVREWARNQGGYVLDTALPDDVAWVRLGIVARRLAADRIPLSWGDILDELAKPGLESPDLDALTARLRARLPAAAETADALATSAAGKAAL